MRKVMIWPGTPERVPCGMFTSSDLWHVVAAMTTNEQGEITKLAAHCGVSTTAHATWSNLATARSRGDRICEVCAKDVVGEGPSVSPAMLPDHVMEKLRQQAMVEGRTIEDLAEEIVAYRQRRNPMRIAACRRGKRRG